jgi:hypothetical protein
LIKNIGMATVAKGVNKIAVALHDWSEDDRQDAIDFAVHPGNGTSTERRK